MPRKILVVDDEAVLVETIASNLEQAGYRVVTASDALSTLEAARSEGGTATTPIMMLKAKGDEIDKVVGLEVGADDYPRVAQRVRLPVIVTSKDCKLIETIEV